VKAEILGSIVAVLEKACVWGKSSGSDIRLDSRFDIILVTVACTLF
jgi:hypothetical protein